MGSSIPRSYSGKEMSDNRRPTEWCAYLVGMVSGMAMGFYLGLLLARLFVRH